MSEFDTHVLYNLQPRLNRVELRNMVMEYFAMSWWRRLFWKQS